MLKLYKVGGLTFQFEEGQQPKGAAEVKPEKAEAKEAAPKNKARKAATK